MKQKNRINGVSILIAIALFINTSSCSNPVNNAQKEKVDEIIASMTLKQKVETLIGTGMHFVLPDSIAEKFPWPTPEIKDTAYHEMVERIRSYLPGAAGFISEYPELGISTQVLADGPAGLRIQPERKNDDKTYYCTAFPIATLLASTWDTELVNKVGQAMGEEVLEYNGDILLAPGMNLQRDPLCGRNFEYYSEDPYVTGKIAAAMVKGIQSNGVGTSIKHFAANNQETNRLSVNTIVSERALRELYLRGFEIAVKEAKPWTVMSAYNKINGAYASESHDLLTKILRDDWGFEGYVMTDWGGGSDVVAQMYAGNDLIMPGTPEQIETLTQAVKDSLIKEEILDKNLSRIFNIMLKSPKQIGVKPTNTPNLKLHAEITRQAATEGMVLLENKENTLPLGNKIKKVATFGTTSYEFIAGGTGSGDVNEAYTISLIQGLENSGFNVDKELTEVYTNYIKDTRAKMGPPKNWLAALLGGKETVPDMEVNKDLALKMSKTNDLALITIGRNSGEGGDRKPEPGDFYLTKNEITTIKNVTEAFNNEGKKCVVILNIGGVIETASWKNIPDAVLCAWQAGQEGGNSVVDVITGKANPSGKLTITWPIKYQDSPSANTFPGKSTETGVKDDAKDLSGFSFMKREPWEVIYEEDIYVGYRYYSTFKVPVSYEFGYGLSYSTFDYRNVKLNSDSFQEQLSLNVDIKNTGKFKGKEIVQIYISAPKGKLEKPELELAAFAKTGLILPGETESLNFEINAKDFASFHEQSSSWIVSPGVYSIKIGSSSTNIKQSISFEVDNEIIVEKVSKALKPNREINKLTQTK